MQTDLVALVVDDERVFKALDGTCLRRDVCRLVKSDPEAMLSAALADPPDLIVVALGGAAKKDDSVQQLAKLAASRPLEAVPILALDFGGGVPATDDGPPSRRQVRKSGPARSGAVDILKMKRSTAAAGLDLRLDEAIQRHLPVLKRTIDRVTVDLPVRCRRRGSVFTVRTKNISPSGLFLKTEKALTPGERLEVRFSLPAALRRRLPSKASVSATCMVVRRVEPESDDAQDLIPGVGVRFLDLDSRVRGVLQSFVSGGGKTVRSVRTTH